MAGERGKDGGRGGGASDAGSSIGSSSASDRSRKKTTGPIHNPRYKAKMCKNWVREGKCPYSEKCQFAHGVAELEKWNDIRRRQSEGRLKGKPVAQAGPGEVNITSNKEGRRLVDEAPGLTGPASQSHSLSRHEIASIETPQPRGLPDRACWADRKSLRVSTSPEPATNFEREGLSPLYARASISERGVFDARSALQPSSSGSVASSSSSVPSFGSLFSISSASASSAASSFCRTESTASLRSSADSVCYSTGAFDPPSRRHSSVSSASSVELLACTCVAPCSHYASREGAYTAGFDERDFDEALKLPSDLLGPDYPSYHDYQRAGRHSQLVQQQARHPQQTRAASSYSRSASLRPESRSFEPAWPHDSADFAHEPHGQDPAASATPPPILSFLRQQERQAQQNQQRQASFSSSPLGSGCGVASSPWAFDSGAYSPELNPSAMPFSLGHQ